MRTKKKDAVSKIQLENSAALELAGLGSTTDALLVMMYTRQGEILQQLQEIQGNTWLR